MRILVWMKKGEFSSYVENLLKTYSFSGLAEPPEQEMPDAYLCSEEGSEQEEAELTPTAKKLLHMRIDCGIKTVQSYSLYPGEQVISICYSYFKRRYRDIPEQTPVIIRETNLAKTYFVFDDVRWNSTQVILPKTNRPVSTECDTIPCNSIPSILGELVMAALKGIASQVGSRAFQYICGEDTTNFDELYDELKRIIKEELTRAEIDKVGGIIRGAAIYVANTYNPQKEAGMEKEKLCQILLPVVKDMAYAMALLSEGRYQKLGFSAYMETTMELVLLNQELASIDPRVDDIRNSAYAEAVRRYAKTALDYMQNSGVYNAILNDRKSHFYYKRFTEGHVVGHDVVTTVYYKWCDGLTGQWSGRFDANNDKDYDPEKDCKQSMERAKTDVANALSENLRYEEVINALNILLEDPLKPII